MNSIMNTELNSGVGTLCSREEEVEGMRVTVRRSRMAGVGARVDWVKEGGWGGCVKEVGEEGE